MLPLLECPPGQVVLAPFVLGQLPDSLECIIVPRRIALLDEELRPPLWLEGAEVGGFEHGAHGPLGGHRMRAHERVIRDQQTTKVL